MPTAHRSALAAEGKHDDRLASGHRPALSQLERDALLNEPKSAGWWSRRVHRARRRIAIAFDDTNRLIAALSGDQSLRRRPLVPVR